MIAQLKAEVRHKEIQKTIKTIKNTKRTDIPKALYYLTGPLMEDYLHDMALMQRYAMLNRKAMMDELSIPVAGGSRLAENFVGAGLDRIP